MEDRSDRSGDSGGRINKLKLGKVDEAKSRSRIVSSEVIEVDVCSGEEEGSGSGSGSSSISINGHGTTTIPSYRN